LRMFNQTANNRTATARRDGHIRGKVCC